MPTSPIFGESDEVKGHVVLTARGSTNHDSVFVELVGFLTDDAQVQFALVKKDLAASGRILAGSREVFAFSFPRMEFPYETYNGETVRVRWLVRASAGRGAGAAVAEADFCVQHQKPTPTLLPAARLEFGLPN